MSHIIATFFYIGYLRPAPGSWGSLVALLVGFAIINTTGLYGLCFAILASFGLGWWATTLQTKDQVDHDPSEIVIDEVAGQWVSLLPLAIWPQQFDISIWYWLLTFGAFRMFDITKPGLVGWADRQLGPLWVMLDDVIAGIMAAAVVGLVMLSLS
jgi:phosphatidylglycerophosphatase A